MKLKHSLSLSLSMVTIVGVFSLVSSAVVTIHPRASTKTLTHVDPRDVAQVGRSGASPRG